MKRFLLIMFFASVPLMPLTANANQSVAKALSTFAWEKRQILLFAPAEQDANYQAFITEADAQSAELVERHLQVWHLVNGHPIKLGGNLLPTKLAVSEFQSVYGVAADEFRVLLIGYDQGEKLRQDEVDIERIFAEIDQMPMRIREMQQEKEAE